MSDKEDSVRIVGKPDLKVDEMFVFVAQGSDGGEGVMAFVDPNSGTYMPMVGADMSRIVSLVPMADAISKASNMPYRIMQFTEKTDITEKGQELYAKEKELQESCDHGDWKFPGDPNAGYKVCGKCRITVANTPPQKGGMEDIDDDLEGEPLPERQADACTTDGECESCS